MSIQSDQKQSRLLILITGLYLILVCVSGVALAEPQSGQAVRIKNVDVFKGESKVAIPVFRIAFERGTPLDQAKLEAITTDTYYHLETHLKNAGFTVMLPDRLKDNAHYARLPAVDSPATVSYDEDDSFWLMFAPAGMKLLPRLTTESDVMLRDMARAGDGYSVLVVTYYVSAQGEITTDSLFLFFGHKTAQCREKCPSSVAQLILNTPLGSGMDKLAQQLKQANITFVSTVAEHR